MDFTILGAAVINGLLLGGIYTLVAVGLTLIYGVLHIINFAHGSLLMLAMFGVYFLLTKWGIDPYAALPLMMLAMYAGGYLLYRGVIGRFSHGKDENIRSSPWGCRSSSTTRPCSFSRVIRAPSRFRIPTA